MIKNNTSSIVFFTAVLDNRHKYQEYIVPFIASALFHNRNSSVEILLENHDAYSEKHEASLNILESHFAQRFLLREIPDHLRNILPNSIRFLTKPQLKADLTYIGDIDILILDSNIADWHMNYMEKNDMPYSNNLRKGGHPMLTGLHCVRTEEYYSKIDESYMKIIVESIKRQGLEYKHYDEKLLYTMAQHRIGLLPKDVYSYKTRPVHGIHMSPNREPLGQPGWEITPLNAVKYLEFRETKLWKDLQSTYSSNYLLELEKLNKAVAPIEEYITSLHR
jgi:hypothetical protein